MALSPGMRLGCYEIGARIGAGGMGEVYAARDLNLGRDVAVKVLPDGLAHDADRLARLRREARLLASLSHPHVAAIHGLEDAGGSPALVMELVEGPTLADRIARGRVPVKEALTIARQVCDALEYAHEQGIVHRDLKPANVKLTPAGNVKVLDFGLAKALQADAGSADGDEAPTMSRTVTAERAVVGTAAYMPPEQAGGKSVDRRADVWAFGCLLYEMLTGARAFDGEDVVHTLAAVLSAEPDWRVLPAATPPEVRVLLSRCLQKDTRRRLQSIGDARLVLEDVLAGVEAPAPAGPRVSAWKGSVAPAFAGVALTAAAGLAAWSLTRQPAPPQPVVRFAMAMPAGQQLALGQRALALSADGQRLAYVATREGDESQHIYLRAMGDMEARLVSGTEGAIDPFFSPDGHWIAFFADGKLKKVPVAGGAVEVLAEAVNSSGGSWSPRGVIAFTPWASVVQMVPDQGGPPRPLTRFAPDETVHLWPEFLPGGDALLFTSPAGVAAWAIGSGERRSLARGTASMPRYVSSGQVVYWQEGRLMALPFDPVRLEARGAAEPVLPGVQQSGSIAQFSVSATGTLAYVPGQPGASFESRLVWVSRDGSARSLGAPPRPYNQPRISPDGRAVAVDIFEGEGNQMQIWLYGLERGTLAQLTFDGVSRHAVWAPDGTRIAFVSTRGGTTRVFEKRVDGSGAEVALTPGASQADILEIPYSWSRDGGRLAYVRLPSTTEAEIRLLQTGGPKSSPSELGAPLFLKTRTADGGPAFSPNGRFIAYASQDETGRREIYVRPASSGAAGRWRISTDGGNEPQWNPNGRELFYRSGRVMMAVEVTTEGGFAAGKPRALFEGPYLQVLGDYVRPNYDVSRDGQRFLMLEPVERPAPPPAEIDVVLNWSEELKHGAQPTK